MVTFTLPPKNLVTDRYALSNYYGAGPIGWVKRERFSHALRVAAPYSGSAIDMGGGGGIFAPSLAKHYDRVVVVDSDSPGGAKFTAAANELIAAMGIGNAHAISVPWLDAEAARARIGSGYSTMFLLETLEHVGDRGDQWGSRVQFLNTCFDLLEPGGRVVVSVPKMVGLVMLVKAVTGRDKMPLRDLLKSAFLRDTSGLEPRWNYAHLGFNHERLEALTLKQFNVERREESFISVFYVLTRP